jgi:hypothetical protein
MNGTYSGPNSYVTKLTGNYGSLGDEEAGLVSPQFDFTGIAANPILKFRNKHKTNNAPGWDCGVVEISINNGAWTRLDNTTGTGTNFNTPNSNSWHNLTNANGFINSGSKFTNTTSTYSTQVNGWVQSSTPLVGAAGQSNVKFRFHFAADAAGTDEGWAIDDIEVSVPTAPIVVTGTSANITTNSASLFGTITSNGNSLITSSGIVYSTTPAPVIGGIGVVDSTTNPIVLSGNYSKATTGLSVGTAYFYRAYAINALGTSYGADSTFTTNSSAVIPTVLKIAASNVNTTTATFGGNITSDGGSAIIASGIVYNTVSNILTVGSSAVDSTTTPLVLSGIFSINSAGLLHSTKYYFKAYATNVIGTAYSALDSFTTSPIVSVLPYNQNFDMAGNTGWTTASINARVNSWELGTPTKTFMNGAYSGANAYVTKLSGNYGSLGNEEAGLISPQFDFTSSTSDPVLRFRNKHKTDNDPGWDCGVVEISINNGAWVRLNNQVGTGANFNTLTSYSWCNLTDANGFINSGNKFTNTTANYASQVNGWVESATRLTGAAGQSNVKIRFHFAADAAGTDEGWAIDDIQVENIVAPSTPASTVALTAITNTTATANWTNGNGQNRLVIARLNSNAAVAPFDSVLYAANAVFGLGNTTGAGNFVVYNGTASSINVTNLALLTNYSFDVYEYNGRYMHNKFTTAATNNTTTLPVKLTYFNAKKVNENVELNWGTSNEINNKGFEVQRSIDGKLFKTIAFVKGAGNSNKNVIYKNSDNNAFAITKSQKLYYRLNQIDFDGKYTLSNIKEVTSNDVQSELVKVYPNPFTKELEIETFSTDNNSICNIQVIDISGRVLMTQIIENIVGTNNTKINNVSSLSAGIYFIKISNNGIVNTVKVIKQ